MKLLVILGLLLLSGVSSTYGEEKSCDEMIVAISSKLKKDSGALKVYKKVEDRTERYLEGTKKASNNVAGLKRALMVAELAMRESGLPREMAIPNVEDRFFHEMGKLLVRDIEDKSSDVVLLCVGRVIMPDGLRHFMLSVTKDEEGDRYWEAVGY